MIGPDEPLQPMENQLYSEPLARRRRWLQQTAGLAGLGKFERSKAQGPGRGRYVFDLSCERQWQPFVCELIDALQAGRTIFVCDPVSYYMAGRVVPIGMRLECGQLVDVWHPRRPPRQ